MLGAMTEPSITAPFRLALPPLGAMGSLVASALGPTLRHRADLELHTLHVPTYAALFETVDAGACDAAWAPPLVALDLAATGAADPVLAVEHLQGISYYAAFVVRDESPVRGVADLSGKHVGWIARQSAAGYVVPRLWLAAIGHDPDALFLRQSFLGSHDQAARALARGEIDVIATYASYDEAQARFLPPDLSFAARVIAAAGPIPSDVIVARRGLEASVVRRLTDALADRAIDASSPLLSLLRIRRFVPASRAHLEPLRTLRARASSDALRALSR
jgi:phosphate/phosphite/phosphonate ABC transporter binding protein